MIFRQLFHQETCTYTYLLADELSREAVLIDPVIESIERDLRLLDELGADRTCTNKHGKTALLLAQESLDKEIAKQGGARKRAKAAPPAKGSL